jgi:type IV pilus assembly protein PilC
VVKLKVPILGKEIFHKSIISRFCRTVGFLLSSGVGLPTSLEIASQVVGHQPMQNAIRDIKKRVIAGSAFSDSIRTTDLFPRLVVKMVNVGEKTGRMDDMLNRTSDYYDSELEHNIQGMMSLLEPVLIVFIGIIVGTVVIALYMPIFKMSSLIQ